MAYFPKTVVALLLAVCVPLGASRAVVGEPARIDPDDGPFNRLFGETSRADKFFRPAVVPKEVADYPAQPAIRLFGDFHSHRTMLIAGGPVSRNCPGVLGSIVSAVAGKVNVVVLVADEDERQLVKDELAKAKLPEDAVAFLTVPVESMWVRDWGPIFVFHNRPADGRSHLVAVDTEYQIRGRRQDNAIPPLVAKHFRARLDKAEILLEGGNLLSNGRGLCLTTTLINRNIARGLEQADVLKMLVKHFGIRQTVVLEPLKGEHSGHVDVFACFTSWHTVVVGSYDKSADPENAAILDRNAKLLSQVKTSMGRLQVVRVPMGDNADGRFRTYTNGIFADGAFLLPRYKKDDTAADRRAVETFSRLLPKWKIQRVDCEDLIKHDGALRCISGYVP